jgi:hypothetical protein
MYVAFQKKPIYILMNMYVYIYNSYIYIYIYIVPGAFRERGGEGANDNVQHEQKTMCNPNPKL